MGKKKDFCRTHMNSDMQKTDKFNFYEISSSSKVKLYSPSPTYSKNIMSQKATIAEKSDFQRR